MERIVEDYQRKWKSLRDRNVRELKEGRNKKSGTSVSVYVSHWCLKYYSISELIIKHTATLQLPQHPVKIPFLRQILYQRMKYLICKLDV